MFRVYTTFAVVVLLAVSAASGADRSAVKWLKLAEGYTEEDCGPLTTATLALLAGEAGDIELYKRSAARTEALTQDMEMDGLMFVIPLLAESYARAGDLDEAFASVNRLKPGVERAMALGAVANAMAVKGDAKNFSRAMMGLQQQLRGAAHWIDESGTRMHIAIAMGYHGDSSRAIRLIGKDLRRHNTGAHALRHIAIIQYEVGNRAGAQSTARRLARAVEDKSTSFVKSWSDGEVVDLIEACAQTGQVDKAVQWLEDAEFSEKDEDKFRVRAHIAMARGYAITGDKAKVKHHLKRADEAVKKLLPDGVNMHWYCRHVGEVMVRADLDVTQWLDRLRKDEWRAHGCMGAALANLKEAGKARGFENETPCFTW